MDSFHVNDVQFERLKNPTVVWDFFIVENGKGEPLRQRKNGVLKWGQHILHGQRLFIDVPYQKSRR